MLNSELNTFYVFPNIAALFFDTHSVTFLTSGSLSTRFLRQVVDSVQAVSHEEMRVRLLPYIFRPHLALAVSLGNLDFFSWGEELVSGCGAAPRRCVSCAFQAFLVAGTRECLFPRELCAVLVDWNYKCKYSN